MILDLSLLVLCRTASWEGSVIWQHGGDVLATAFYRCLDSWHLLKGKWLGTTRPSNRAGVEARRALPKWLKLLVFVQTWTQNTLVV